MLKAVFFDFDGVICNTEPSFFEFKLQEMAKLGFPVTREFLLKHVGESFRVMFPREFKVDNALEIIHKYYSDMENENINYASLMYPELLDLLKFCKENNLICAITSNSKQSRLEKVTVELNIREYFDELYSNERLGVSKPNPLFYTNVCKQLNIQPEEALVIEDSTPGIHAAVHANIKTVAIAENYFNLDQSEAHYIVNQHSEVIDIIKTLLSSVNS